MLFSSLQHLKTLEFKDPKPQTHISSMEEPQNPVRNLSEMTAKYAVGEVEVHLEPQIETTPVAELEGQEEEQNLAQKGRKHKRA